eukprot:scaffold9928_cov63-Phaeocystis_antarctica.AAC.1
MWRTLCARRRRGPHDGDRYRGTNRLMNASVSEGGRALTRRGENVATAGRRSSEGRQACRLGAGSSSRPGRATTRAATASACTWAWRSRRPRGRSPAAPTR